MPPPGVRVTVPAPQELTEAQRAVYDAIASGPRRAQGSLVPVTDTDGRLLGPFDLMRLSPEIGQAVQQVGAMIRFRSGLTKRCRELAILTVAVRLGSAFE